MRYRLNCCSDTHGNRLPELGDDGAVAWLHAGDAYDGPGILADDEQPLSGDPLAEPMRAWVRTRSIPIYTVRGNHDVSDPYGWFAATNAVDGLVIRLGQDLLIAGLGWHGERYFECPEERDVEKVCESIRWQMRRLAKSTDRVVLLTHYPARAPGLFPRREGAIIDAGYERIAALVQELRPILIVSGHEHRWFGLTGSIYIGDQQVTVMNPGPSGMSVGVDTTAGTIKPT